jgi:hypothetical protein
MAAFISEWWPASFRNTGRLHVGIPGRIESESAATYAISVVAEHGEGSAKVAAPIARDIMRKALEIDRHRPGPPAPQVAHFTVDS